MPKKNEKQIAYLAINRKAKEVEDFFVENYSEQADIACELIAIREKYYVPDEW